MKLSTQLNDYINAAFTGTANGLMRLDGTTVTNAPLV